MNSLKENIFKYLIILIGFGGIFLAIFGIWKPYSYWIDELYSVTASEISFVDMFKNLVLYDVHPPLYQVILKIWIGLFGSIETVTRTLSLIFSLSSLVVFVKYFYKNLSKYTAIISISFFTSNFLFIYYSQETRSYSMMLFLSTILTILAIDKIINDTNKKTIFYIAIFSILLSMTHHFGLIYTGFVLFFLLVYLKNIKEQLLIIVSGLLSLSWIVFHYLFGNLGIRTGGNFWIKSDGVLTTIFTYVDAMLPQLSTVIRIMFNYQKILISILTILVFVVFYYLISKKIEKNKISFILKDSNKNKNVFIFMIFIIIGFVFLIAMIDLHTPISTTRNYIVLLPITSLLIGFIFSSFPRNVLFSLFIIGLLYASLLYSYKKISSKQYPIQNPKEATIFIEENKLLKNRSFYYKEIPNIALSKMENKIAIFYFKNKEQIMATPINENDLSTLDSRENFIFFSQHRKIDIEAILEELNKAGFKNIQYYKPKEKWGNTIVIWNGDANESN
ncbi:MAG: glycosyltransferase family 39 protein [Spirochaetota bacterium]